MRALVVGIAALACSGCFTSWVAVQATSSQRLLEEGTREERVYEPDVRERLRVDVPLARRELASSSTALPSAQPFALACRATQTASETVHTSSFRYGGKWKRTTASMLLLEVASAALAYYGSTDEQDYRVLAGFFAVDAVGTAALFFAPRKELFRQERRSMTTPFRRDCPEGLVLDVAGEAFPVDAAGGIGELGQSALDAWMAAPSGPLRLALDAQVQEVRVSDTGRCTWQRTYHPEQPARCVSDYAAASVIGVDFDVPTGTLTRVTARP